MRMEPFRDRDRPIRFRSRGGGIELDQITRLLLDQLQRSFPVETEPYRILAGKLGVAEQDVIERIGQLKEERLVRQISAIFNTGAVGYRSSLIGMAVPEQQTEEAARVINRYPGVSHNYLRPGRFNIWYTIAVPPGKQVEEVVKSLTAASGGWPTLVLPALKKYKLAVVLDVLDESDEGMGSDTPDVPATEASVAFRADADSIRLVRCVQEDLPLVPRPFGQWAERLGCSESELVDRINRWVDQGVVRRFAAVLNHREVGFSANGMVVWSCPLERIDQLGRILASHSEVSHCYYRPAHDDWPYNLYAMVHGRSVDDCEDIAARLAAAIGNKKYRIMFSTKEFKKIRLKLFWEEPSLCCG